MPPKSGSHYKRVVRALAEMVTDENLPVIERLSAARLFQEMNARKTVSKRPQEIPTEASDLLGLRN